MASKFKPGDKVLYGQPTPEWVGWLVQQVPDPKHEFWEVRDDETGEQSRWYVWALEPYRDNHPPAQFLGGDLIRFEVRSAEFRRLVVGDVINLPPNIGGRGKIVGFSDDDQICLVTARVLADTIGEVGAPVASGEMEEAEPAPWPQPGDLVQLKSGSPPMVISRVWTGDDNEVEVSVAFIDGSGQYNSPMVTAAALEPYQVPPLRAVSFPEDETGAPRPRAHVWPEDPEPAAFRRPQESPPGPPDIRALFPGVQILGRRP